TAYAVAPSRWWGVAALFVVGLVYLAVLSGLSTTVQLYAPPAYRGRVISFFQVALGVSYPIGALVQGPLADAVGIGWTTAGSAVLLGLVGLVTWWRWPAFGRALLGTELRAPGDDTVQATAPDMAR
ncbi:MAG: MFS transporter, partial [Actinobacteria bacterium]|nr:MFS transporter [Actinomycetota bacterium]